MVLVLVLLLPALSVVQWIWTSGNESFVFYCDVVAVARQVSLTVAFASIISIWHSVSLLLCSVEKVANKNCLPCDCVGADTSPQQNKTHKYELSYSHLNRKTDKDEQKGVWVRWGGKRDKEKVRRVKKREGMKREGKVSIIREGFVAKKGILSMVPRICSKRLWIWYITSMWSETSPNLINWLQFCLTMCRLFKPNGIWT